MTYVRAWTRNNADLTITQPVTLMSIPRGSLQVTPMKIARILPGIAVLNGRIFVCGGEVDSQILANGEVRKIR